MAPEFHQKASDGDRRSNLLTARETDYGTEILAGTRDASLRIRCAARHVKRRSLPNAIASNKS